MNKTEPRDTGFLIKRIGDRLRARADCRLKQYGLTFSQICVIGRIDMWGGSATQKQIERAMGVSHPTVVGLVGRLESAGFVRCETDEKDRRNKIIHLEPKAYAIEAEIQADREKNEAILTAGMTEEESELLYRLLERAYANFDGNSEHQEET